MRIFLLCLLLTPFITFSQNYNESAISKSVLQKIETEPNAYQPIIIMLENQVNLEQLVNHFDEHNISSNERPKFVINVLKDKAENTQTDLLDYLRNVPNVLTETIHPYWIANLIFVQAKPEIIAALSQRADVAWIALSGPLKIESVSVTPAPPVVPNGKEPGLQVVGAPFMWAMGYTGYGQLAFTNDTGVDRFHPAFEGKYRGLFSETSATWFQYNEDSMIQIPDAEPFDRNGHGTHVNGTILGLDRVESDTVGVAFNAQWIGSAILNGIGTADNVASFEWSLDPDGDPNTVDDMPDVINNSWYDPTLDEEDCTSIYVPVLEALEAAGVAVVFSAGNEGSGPMTITQPHNININLVNTFTVGALNGNTASLSIADFSSRGPSHCGGEGSLLIKPEVSAPGVNVRSSRPDGTYDFLSGTSMAAPHVSGCILLLKEAFPQLTGKELKEALYFSCIDLGAMGEDNTYGMGVVNLENAYNYLLDLGHVPVSPHRNTDALLIDFKIRNVYCENTVLIEDVLIENAGTDTLYSFEIKYSMGNFSDNFIWEGALAPLERVNINLPLFSASDGNQLLEIVVENPNNVEDERPLNNKLERFIKVTNRSNIEAFSLSGDASCENSNALLQASYEEDIQVAFEWYDAPFEGDLLGTGDFYITEDLEESTTIYASAIFTEHLGETGIDLANSIDIDTNNVGLSFDAHADFTLKSVMIYANEKSVRQIVIRDKDDHNLRTKTIVIDTGFHRIDLDFHIPAGDGYTLLKSIGKGFAANTQTVNFPYEINAVCTINGKTGSVDENTFPMFYDWEIEYENPCFRTPVLLEITPSENLPTAAFSVSQDTINLFFDELGEISFTDNSTDATNWQWNFSDGTTSTEQNPVHQFTTPGNYQIGLTVTDENGCSHSAINNLVVIFSNPTAIPPSPTDDLQVAVYPNPVKDQLQIAFLFSKQQSVNLTLVNAMGEVIKTEQNKRYFNENISWEVGSLSAGIYYVMIEIEGKIKVEKVVKF